MRVRVLVRVHFARRGGGLTQCGCTSRGAVSRIVKGEVRVSGPARSPVDGFNRLQATIADIIKEEASEKQWILLRSFTPSTSIRCLPCITRREWMDEEDYRAAWESEGYQLPADI